MSTLDRKHLLELVEGATQFAQDTVNFASYVVTVKTSDQKDAGTDSTPQIRLCGVDSNGHTSWTGWHDFTNIKHYDEMERGDVDSWSMVFDKDVGDVFLVELKNQGSGMWICEWVTVARQLVYFESKLDLTINKKSYINYPDHNQIEKMQPFEVGQKAGDFADAIGLEDGKSQYYGLEAPVIISDDGEIVTQNYTKWFIVDNRNGNTALNFRELSGQSIKQSVTEQTKEAFESQTGIKLSWGSNAPLGISNFNAELSQSFTHATEKMKQVYAESARFKEFETSEKVNANTLRFIKVSVSAQYRLGTVSLFNGAKSQLYLNLKDQNKVFPTSIDIASQEDFDTHTDRVDIKNAWDNDPRNAAKNKKWDSFKTTPAL